MNNVQCTPVYMFSFVPSRSTSDVARKSKATDNLVRMRVRYGSSFYESYYDERFYASNYEHNLCGKIRRQNVFTFIEMNVKFIYILFRTSLKLSITLHFVFPRHIRLVRLLKTFTEYKTNFA